MSAKTCMELLTKTLDQLSAGDQLARSGPPCMDFRQDAPYIRAAFLQQYGISLDAERGRLSWWTFCDLLQGLTDATTFMRIVQIRTTPIPKRTKTNADEIRHLMEQKRAFRIDDGGKTFADQLDRLFETVKAQARAGEKE